MSPMDVIKQRQQYTTGKYKNFIHCGKLVMRTEGVRALYAGFSTTLIMNIPYGAVYFPVYEYCTKYFSTSDEWDAKVHLSAGYVAGLVAAFVTNPLDVTKTRLQLQGDLTKGKYKGIYA